MAQYFQISFNQLKQLFPNLSTTVGEDSVQYTVVNQGQELHLNNLQLSNLQVQDEVRQGAIANNCISVVKAENLNGQYCLSLKDVNPDTNNVYVLEGLGTPSNSTSVIQSNEVNQLSHQQAVSTNSLPSKPVQTIYITTAPSHPVAPGVTYVSVPSEEVSDLSVPTGTVGDPTQKTHCVPFNVDAASMTKLLSVNKENHVSLDSKGEVELEEVGHTPVLSSPQVRVIQNSVNRLASQVESKTPPTQLITLTVPQQSVATPSSVVRQIQSNCQLSTTQVSLPNGQKISLQEYRQMHPQSQNPVIQTVKGLGRGESPAQVNRSSPKTVKRTPRRGGVTPRSMKRASPGNSVSPGRVIILDQRRDMMEQNLLLVRNDSLQGSINQEQEPAQLIRQGSNRNITTEGTLEQTSSGGFGGSPALAKHNIEERKLVPGKVAHCQYCGYHSEDFNRCDRCRRKVPINCKEMPITHSKIIKDGLSCQKIFKGIREGGTSDGNMPKADRNLRTRKPRKFEEPVILTISSDEDEETESKSNSNLKEGSGSNYDYENGGMSYGMDHMLPPLSTLSALDKEPIIKDSPCSEPLPEEDHNVAQAIEGLQESQNGVSEGEKIDKERAVFLTCRTVRIGSYKAVPKDRVVICKQGIRIHVPDIEDSSKSVSITFTLKDVVKALIHFGRAMPVIFLYTSYQCGVKIRHSLRMTSKCGLFYDPCALDETQKRITLLPERMTEDTKSRLKSIFCDKGLLVELDSKEANDILVRASPKEVQETIKKSIISSPTMTSLKPVKDYTQKILIYPPPPAKGGITINPEDYMCLGEEQFLNDVIIDFYLKYLTQSCLSEVDQSRTHVFSSFFYKRLTTRPVRSARRHHPVEMDGTSSPAEKRHARVKSWTKNVNIFEKDFIVIPINESAHWFLAIICFPGLEGCVRMSDGVPVKLPPTQPRPSKKNKGTKKSEIEKEEMIPATCIVKPIQIGNTTITPITTPTLGGPAGTSAIGLPVATINLEERDGGLGGDDFSDRDEAEGEEEDIQMPSESEDEMVEGGAGDLRNSVEGDEDSAKGSEEKEEEGKASGKGSEEEEEEEAGVEEKDKVKGQKENEEVESMEEGEEEEGEEEEGSSEEIKGQKSSNTEKNDADEVSKPDDAKKEDGKEADNENIEYCSHNDPIKQPCILIFDSLAGSSRSRVVATLRDYLRIEYKAKTGTEREFSKDTIKGACPRVPQQTNFVDCGLYVLQYVESFFENPVKDYRIPIRSLTQWFPEEVVNRKREAIHELIIKLMKEQNITVKLPKIVLPSPLSRTNFLHDEEEEGGKVLAAGDIGEMLKVAQEQGQLIVKTDQSGNRVVASGMRLVSMSKVGDKMKVVFETMGGSEPIRVEQLYCNNAEDRVVSGLADRRLGRRGESVEEGGEAEEEVLPSKEAEGLEEGELEEEGIEDEEMELDKELEEKEEEQEEENEIQRRQANTVVRAYQAMATKRKSIHQEESIVGTKNKDKCEAESGGKKLKS